MIPNSNPETTGTSISRFFLSDKCKQRQKPSSIPGYTQRQYENILLSTKTFDHLIYEDESIDIDTDSNNSLIWFLFNLNT